MLQTAAKREAYDDLFFSNLLSVLFTTCTKLSSTFIIMDSCLQKNFLGPPQLAYPIWP